MILYTVVNGFVQQKTAIEIADVHDRFALGYHTLGKRHNPPLKKERTCNGRCRCVPVRRWSRIFHLDAKHTRGWKGIDTDMVAQKVSKCNMRKLPILGQYCFFFVKTSFMMTLYVTHTLTNGAQNGITRTMIGESTCA